MIARVVRLLYPLAVYGYELVKAEVKKSQEPDGVPLPFTAVQRINDASHVPEKFKVPPKAL